MAYNGGGSWVPSSSVFILFWIWVDYSSDCGGINARWIVGSYQLFSNPLRRHKIWEHFQILSAFKMKVHREARGHAFEILSGKIIVEHSESWFLQAERVGTTFWKELGLRASEDRRRCMVNCRHLVIIEPKFASWLATPRCEEKIVSELIEHGEVPSGMVKGSFVWCWESATEQQPWATSAVELEPSATRCSEFLYLVRI